MTDLKTRFLAVFDKVSAELDNAPATENTVPTVAAQIETRTKANPKWLALIDKFMAEQNDASSDNEIVLQTPTPETSIDSDPEVADESANETIELPIFAATTRELDYWHASGCNLLLQNLLREYDLDYSSYNLNAYDEFKIGFDDRRHVATFAIDETHYHVIQFNEVKSAPVNRDDAEKVLSEIQRLRRLRDDAVY